MVLWSRTKSFRPASAVCKTGWACVAAWRHVASRATGIQETPDQHAV